MSGFRVQGLLDRPSKESLGMLGLIVERDIGLQVEGIVGGKARPIAEAEFSELVSSGDAQRVNGLYVEDDGRPYAALWIGKEFGEKARRLGVLLPPLPRTSATVDDNGTYWVAPTHHVWLVIDSWLTLAFRSSINENNPDLATLMAWALPEREETRAALWYTMKDTRESNLNWWTRLERDHGNSQATASSLSHRFDQLSRQCLTQRFSRVFAFCARAKGGDNEIAELLSQELKAQRLSFGRWLRKRAEREGRPATRRVLQEQGQQMIDTHGALEFCLEVLSELPPNVSIPRAHFVIDGIRHAEVEESLKSLIGERQFTLVYIDRPEEERRNLLISEEHIPPNEVDEVMNDPTEREISVVASRAAKTFNRRQGVGPIATALIGVT